MPTITDTVTTADGACPVVVAFPDGTGPWPGVIMCPDAGGPRPTLTAMAQELADAGYVVLVPDFYYRHGQWAPFEMTTAFGDPAERSRIFTMMKSVTPDMLAGDAVALFDYLASRPEVSGQTFGTTGYCMGGRASLTVAGRVPERVAAALSFHGGGLAADNPDSPHLLATALRAAVYVAGAENDASFTTEQAELLDSALTVAGVEHTIETYPAAHGFCVPDNATYDESAAARHRAATRAFLAAHLS